MSTTPAWVEIDAGAIAHNLDLVRGELGTTTRLCGVVKADAYGHGISVVLPILMAAGVDVIGITSNTEAEEARRRGFSGRILRLRAALREEVEDGGRFDIEEWVGGDDHARVLTAAARSLGRPVRTHLSLNSTGLSRDGVDWNDPRSQPYLRRIAASRELTVVGICSHFPCEDADDVIAGAHAFRNQAGAAERLLGAPRGLLEKHCATSYAALSVPESRMDMVRIGAALYGDTSAAVPGLRPAMRLVSRVAAINPYPAGSTIGYDRAGRLDGPGRLAVVPVGYADGYPRVLGGSASVLVRGTFARVVDRLAMNSLIVDVTHVPSAGVGDEVVLYGRQGSAQILSADIERASGTIAAAAYTAWGRLNPRVVVNVPVCEPTPTP
ncbi:alanine racemase [Microbacterium sp. LWH3-1.2]|uniref:alanine racemase n=1 Tax=Microbacterium sp. LWH3-1.2 TaxID=3135256 RepID=UPI0034444530